MSINLTDDKILELIQEPKFLPADYRSKLQVKPRRGHKERELDITGKDGNRFRLILRQSDYNALDFSVILAYLKPETNSVFRLMRYNGKHEHTNLIEKNRFYDFHIHEATARYQEKRMKEDAYAYPTKSYADFYSAIDCMIRDCAFQSPPETQGNLFPEV